MGIGSVVIQTKENTYDIFIRKNLSEEGVNKGVVELQKEVLSAIKEAEKEADWKSYVVDCMRASTEVDRSEENGDVVFFYEYKTNNDMIEEFKNDEALGDIAIFLIEDKVTTMLKEKLINGYGQAVKTKYKTATYDVEVFKGWE
ncbi:hypothetical protein [Bacillus badius]|uniref:hypothetical protein n=1 Tax=Bacillus badius TaxID=1455 RepID=UPI0007B38FC0|nr:hypothetical protein [Bacillus badius]KZR56949.1 hypothetical protein A3781_20425 [Bacillus badius]